MFLTINETQHEIHNVSIIFRKEKKKMLQIIVGFYLESSVLNSTSQHWYISRRIVSPNWFMLVGLLLDLNKNIQKDSHIWYLEARYSISPTT